MLTFDLSAKVSHVGLPSVYYANIRWASMQENSSRIANNKGADQPAHPCNLISVFIIRLLKSTMSKLLYAKF